MHRSFDGLMGEVRRLIPAVDDSDWWIAVEAGVDGKADLTKPAGAGEENQRSQTRRTQARNNPNQDPTV
jgi:hypothetical protein